MNAAASSHPHSLLGTGHAYSRAAVSDELTLGRFVKAEWQATRLSMEWVAHANFLATNGELPIVLVGPDSLWEFLSSRLS